MVDSENVLLRQIERGEKAHRLLEDEMLQEAFALVEQKIRKMFDDAPLRDEEGIVKSKYLLHCFRLVKGAIEQAVQTGQLAEKQLADKRRGVRWLGDVWPSRQSRR